MSEEPINLEAVTLSLATDLDKLNFGPPVATTYNVLRHAWRGHLAYLEKYGAAPKRILFLGMNPGPWGMVQTGVPFGEVDAVRDWMKIETVIDKPANQHPKRPIQGFACERSEVSGRRLWGFLAQKFRSPEIFFADHFVVNYCPLAFMEESGRNLTPDKLPIAEAKPLQDACDQYLRGITQVLRPEWIIGVGVYGEKRAKMALGAKYRYGRILHPSPANPSANAGWADKVSMQMKEMGAWQ